MRFSITMPDDLVEQIDEEADRTGGTRADWIRQACTDRLTRPAPEEHQAHQDEVIELRARGEYQARTISDLEADRGYLRGEVARLAQETARLSQANDLLMHRLLPAPKTGALSRVRRWLSGGDEPGT